jgi:hypothetical protein
MSDSYQVASRLKEYVTFNTSPLTTVRSPGAWKSDTENKMPDVPVATFAKNAPAIVAFAFIVNDAVEDALLMLDGSANVAAPNVAALRSPV